MRGWVADIPIPSVLYRNNIVSTASFVYTQLTSYIPRILAKLSKYSILRWVLVELNINYGWLFMLLVAIL